jgi:hypothetical protein
LTLDRGVLTSPQWGDRRGVVRQELCLEPFWAQSVKASMERGYKQTERRTTLHICSLPKGHYSPGHYCHEHQATEDE